MPIALIAIWKYIVANKYVQYILLILTLITIVTTLLIHSINVIKTKQELKDQIKQEQLYNDALEDQIKKDKIIIDNFNIDIANIKNKQNILKTDTESVIKNNSNWANTPLPNGLEGVGE